MKKFLQILVPVVLSAAVVLVSFFGYTPRDVYAAAMTAMSEGDYEMARSHLERLEGNEEAEQLLEQLYFVPTRVATTYADGTTELQSYAYTRMGCMVKAELTQMEQVVSTTSYSYTTSGQMLTKDLLLAGQTRPETSTENFYDEMGRLICTRTVGDIAIFQQTTYTYDAQGRCITAFAVEGDGSWVRTEYEYDQDGQCVTEAAITDKGTKTVHHYNQEGHLLAVMVNGKPMETYAYNQKGLLVKVTYADGRVITYTYNEVGQMTEMRAVDSPDQQNKITQEYNEKGLLTQRVTEDADAGVLTETFKYNKKNLCVSYRRENQQTGESEAYTYAYDRHGNLETETYESAAGGYERTYKWKNRHYPKGMPEMIAELVGQYQPKE